MCPRASRSSSAAIVFNSLACVALPTTIERAKAGFYAFGIDLHRDRCEMLRADGLYAAELNEVQVLGGVFCGHFFSNCSSSSLAEAEVITICVPTPLCRSNRPDLTAMIGAAAAATPQLRVGPLIVLASTRLTATAEEVLRAARIRTGVDRRRRSTPAFSENGSDGATCGSADRELFQFRAVRLLVALSLRWRHISGW